MAASFVFVMRGWVYVGGWVYVCAFHDVSHVITLP